MRRLPVILMISLLSLSAALPLCGIASGAPAPQDNGALRSRMLQRLRDRSRTDSAALATPAVPDPSADPSAGLSDTDDILLSEEDKTALQERVRDKIEEFQNYTSQIANRNITSGAVKDRCYRNALKLFIGEGEDFTVFDPALGKNVRKDAAQILSRTGTRPKKPYYVRDYLASLRKSRRYDFIEISDVDVVRVDRLEKVGDHYETMAYFCQKYVGYRGENVVYADMTSKKVRVIFNPISIELPDGKTETIWNAYLYDIYTIDTRKI